MIRAQPTPLVERTREEQHAHRYLLPGQTPGQKNTTSLPEQERINRAHAAQLGWEVSEPHVYREVEGGEDLYRPCMDRLWDGIIHHEIDAVVVDVLDRLSA